MTNELTQQHQNRLIYASHDLCGAGSALARSDREIRKLISEHLRNPTAISESTLMRACDTLTARMKVLDKRIGNFSLLVSELCPVKKT